MTTPVRGSRVAIIGGSIAGCSAAIALIRAGCDVTVYERSPHELRDRGFGIALPLVVRDELAAAGYLDPAMPVQHCAERVWLVRPDYPSDGARSAVGRVAWRQQFPAAFANWGILWRTLRGIVPDDSYRRAASVSAMDMGERVTVVTDNGRREAFDLVVAADGYRSATRLLVDPASRPTYAGYVLWRGNYPEDRLPAPPPREFAHGAVWVCFPHGHAIFYLIPDFTAGHRRINWAVYGFVPTDPGSMPPGSVSDALVRQLDGIVETNLFGYWAAVVKGTRLSELSLQPVYDVTIPTYVSSRIVLVGDAGTVARPHTGSGATKAMEDALALERACSEHDSWPEVLAAYDRERCPFGNELVELGRRLGRAQVQHTPPWDRMTAGDFQHWMTETLAGRRFLYDP